MKNSYKNWVLSNKKEEIFEGGITKRNGGTSGLNKDDRKKCLIRKKEVVDLGGGKYARW